MSETYSQIARRKYPQNKFGKKAEWHAVESQKDQINKQIQKYEQEVKSNKRSDLVYLNDVIRNEMQEKKQKNQEFLRNERNHYQNVLQENDQQNFRLIEQKNLMTKKIANVYDSQIQDRSLQYRNDKNINIQSDRSHLITNDRTLQVEQSRYAQQLIDKNKVMEQKEQKYFQNLLPAQQEKQKEYQLYIQSKMDTRNQILLKQEVGRQNDIKTINKEIRNINDYLLDERKQIQIDQKNHQSHQQQQRLQNLQLQQQIPEFERKNRIHSQLQYKNLLDNQTLEKEKQSHLDDKMSSVSKSLNKHLLQDYKNSEANIKQYIPGLQPQIGAVSNREQKRLSSPSQKSQKSQRSFQDLQFQSMNNSNYQSRYVNEKEKLMNSWMGANKSQNENKFRYNHNTILNPVPFVNQNPYIQKELNSGINNRIF